MTQLEIVDSGEVVRVGKILCLVGNYRKHVDEMGGKISKELTYFLKPATSLVGEAGRIILPQETEEVHHEIELGVVVGDRIKNATSDEARSKILGYCIFLDITARDIQARAKKSGRPWSIAKGFDTFAPVSRVMPADKVGDPGNLEMVLKVNGETRQSSSTRFMERKVHEILSEISRVMTLEKGDLVATGTPEGVGLIKPGDEVEAYIEKIGILKIGVAGGGN
jgi:2-keto-4-pentenoate hydratase/2-oxohepta-3-ene-1,7-dioic acid hydratase in catechol pathway